ncbi:nucleoside-diphosphate kinase [Candidatus Gottesmanbacteria bacterium RIFCSPHIGHO2_01_FULL_42_12]|uniref:nucleoside-diphosphate kinase n=1 Tax=Candidatus Gottesmanbacteria bacterium RIFCSPHIGHO2_01_FULL_42_12 TaxID=1798377 RepID=A0A1F5Z5N1_9BACT|nr:MAG: nucleoside-diphosphate kinase [Candidatus Gottesmanbacteria bacterium RIFCSPHIGHO2_01_FULL_42_12]
MERTVVLVKPDGVQRGLVGEIIARFEKVSLKIIAMKMVWIDKDFASKHYMATREEWLKTIGERTLKTNAEYGRNTKEILGTEEAMEIGKMVAGWLIEYLCEGPVVAMLLEGNHAVDAVRKIAGNTIPLKAEPHTIRGAYSVDSMDLANDRKRPGKNVMHSSGNLEEAKYEAELWFNPEEIHDYKLAHEDVAYG